MSDKQWTHARDAAKVAISFVNAFAAVIAGYPGPDLSPLVRLLAVATVAGCGGALLLLTPPGRKGRVSEDITVSALADELEKRTRQRTSGLRAVNRDG